MRQKVLKTGNSLSISIPSKFVRILGLKPGMDVDVRADYSHGLVTCYFDNTNQLPLIIGEKTK